MRDVSNVLIVGGGIAGITLGIALTRAGIHAEIVEKNPQWAAIGVGISLQGPALRALRSLGLLEPCIALGFGYSSYIICDADGNVTGTVDLPNLNGPGFPATVGIKRQNLHSVLVQAVTGENLPVRLGTSVISLRQSGGAVSVQFDDGTAGNYDLVVGADGANSIVRDLVFGSEPPPVYTGQAVWRATIRRPTDVQCYAYNGPRNKIGFNPVSQQQMYVFLHENLPAFVRVADDDLPAKFHDQLTDFGGMLSDVREQITTPDQILYRPVTSHISPPPWHRGRILLIGDAAHTSAPHMASGVALAIEDSIVLASVLTPDQPLQNALEQFMARRYERCLMVVENALQISEWEKSPGSPDADHVGLLDKSFRTLAQPI